MKMLSMLVMLALISACATSNTTKIGSKSYAPRSESCEVEVFSQGPNDRKYEEIAMINARGGQSIFEGKSVQDLIPDMKKQACLAGGDAIIIKDSKEGGYNFAGPADRAQAAATVIKFLNR